MHMELNSVKRIFFISHHMGRTKSRKTAHKCSSNSSDDGGAGLIPYRTAKTFTIFVKCFDCFLLRKNCEICCRSPPQPIKFFGLFDWRNENEKIFKTFFQRYENLIPLPCIIKDKKGGQRL